ncbi:MAG: YdeI/OmpD-associated family protein [Shinella sp.]|uniref:YdeI/OmpD-associated family protein n=1 Tax=Shinella sp. TaxID=1870904 RepID=UPI003C71D53E
MAPVEINPDHVREFEDPESFYRWLGENHAAAPEVWIKVHKRASGLKSITPEEAIEVVLCWGWIDGIRKGLDERSFFQRYSPRGRKSVWSKKNVETVGRLVEGGRMTEHGLKQVEAAKADGRWEKAYGSGRDLPIPPDLQLAIDADPIAKDMLGKLTEQNRFALAFRMHNLKTEAARTRKIEAFVEMLKRGETIYPQKRK